MTDSGMFCVPLLPPAPILALYDEESVCNLPLYVSVEVVAGESRF